MVERHYLAQAIWEGFLEEATFEANNTELDEESTQERYSSVKDNHEHNHDIAVWGIEKW